MGQRTVMARRTTIQEKYEFENPFKADPLVRRALLYCSGERLLDLGCGEGADSVFFARRGFTVTALEENRAYLKRLRSYISDKGIKNVALVKHDATTYRYPRNRFDVISCILVICCMKRSDFERMLPRVKRCVKPGGIIIMSSRNYLDPELREYRTTQRAIEPNTYRKKEDCCKFMYFIEKGRLRDLFSDFDVLYSYEGYAPCKYGEHPKHGDSYIICRRPSQNGSRR